MRGWSTALGTAFLAVTLGACADRGSGSPEASAPDVAAPAPPPVSGPALAADSGLRVSVTGVRRPSGTSSRWTCWWSTGPPGRWILPRSSARRAGWRRRSCSRRAGRPACSSSPTARAWRSARCRPARGAGGTTGDVRTVSGLAGGTASCQPGRTRHGTIRTSMFPVYKGVRGGPAAGTTAGTGSTRGNVLYPIVAQPLRARRQPVPVNTHGRTD